MGDPSPARETDLALAQRAAAGNREAQRELFQAQKIGVHRALFRILGANRELEDLLQDAFLEIFRSLKNFRGDSTLARWSQTIATRVASPGASPASSKVQVITIVPANAGSSDSNSADWMIFLPGTSTI